MEIFLEFSCLFCDPTDVANWSLVPLPFSKSSLYIWKSLIHILLKPSLKDFEPNLASMWNECNCTVLWTFFGIAFLWDWNENWPFSVLCPLLSFPNLLAYWWFGNHLLRIWNSSAGVPSPSLVLFIVMLPKAPLTSHSMSGYRIVTTLLWLSGSLRPFLYSFSVYSCYLFLISSASVRSLPSVFFIVPIFAWIIPLVSPSF